MKKLAVIIISLILVSCGSTQTFPAPETVTKTLQLKSDHNSNYIKANEWMVENFGDAESVIQFTDKDAGIVKGKYSMYSGQAQSAYTPAVGRYFSMITLRVKDNGAKIEVAPLGKFSVFTYMGVKHGYTPTQFIESANALVANFEEHMNKKSANDNW